AVLHMDGDGMGRNLSAIRELKLHQQFSQKLAEFADVHVPRIIQEFGGENATLVYAGGDDVLALLPLRNALNCANELQKTFISILEKAFPQLGKFTTSAGIAITPHDFPLDVALEMARTAEESAKDNYRITPKQRGEMGYGAIVITEAHSTGMIREAGANWDVVPLMDALIGYFADDTLSGKLGYDMLTIAHDMGGRVPADARQAELKRIIIRRLSEKIPTDDKKDFADDLAKQISRLAEQKDANGKLRWQDMAHWTILARFIAKPPKQGAVI
ncbi:MAG TPA: type III-B CRISPR-associated protein Cas10/Cmr2, partial [Aggregatilineales bacterium]|nr:type III-B CRISPR-associated protein Cas10/Cmr2 [Aggregatilineales bacterium]